MTDDPVQEAKGAAQVYGVNYGGRRVTFLLEAPDKIIAAHSTNRDDARKEVGAVKDDLKAAVEDAADRADDTPSPAP
jgi:hypothetical protein